MNMNILAAGEDDDDNTTAMAMNVGTNSDDNKLQATKRPLTRATARVLSTICRV